MCGEIPVNMRKGIDIRPPIPTMESARPVASPIRRTEMSIIISGIL